MLDVEESLEFDFPDVNQVAVLRRTRENLKSGKVEECTHYLITSLTSEQADANRLMELKRGYWDIENKLHYVKDMVFGEDRSTIRSLFGPRNMAALRNFAVGLYRASGVENIKRAVENVRHNPTGFVQALLATT